MRKVDQTAIIVIRPDGNAVRLDFQGRLSAWREAIESLMLSSTRRRVIAPEYVAPLLLEDSITAAHYNCYVKQYADRPWLPAMKKPDGSLTTPDGFALPPDPFDIHDA